MHAVLDAAQSLGVTDRGDDIQRRLEALGISDREFERKTGIDRKTLRRAIGGDEHTRANTYKAIEDGLTELERRIAGIQTSGDDLIEFRLSGNFGVDVVVKGPIRDRSELEDAVARLIREMRGDK